MIDSTFSLAVVSDGSTASTADCIDHKAGYCISWSSDVGTNPQDLIADFGWKASTISVQLTGRRDFAGFADKVIKCTVSTGSKGAPGEFEAKRSDDSVISN